MENSTPVSGSLDKSRVLDVRPLRCLLPVFPSAPNSSSFPNTQDGAPFGFAPPSGPLPPGVAPFYPFGSPGNPAAVPNQNAHFTFTNPISTAVPITTIRTPSTQHAADANGDTSKPKRPKSSIKSLKKTKAGRHIDIALADADIESVVENVLASSNLTTFDMVQQANGDKELVAYILMMYDFLRRKVTQIEESKEAIPGVTRRPDLRVGNILMNKKIRTNMRRRIGAVAGVEVGDIFFFRMELCLIGLHAPCMAGIDYMNLKISQDDDPIAVSIVSSGGYEDNMEDGDVLIYSGQGGNYYRKGKEISDQKLERGNLALEKSLHRGNEVRVIRGFKDVAYTTGKVYVYDGLYKIQESWVEKGKSGCSIFKYKLVRLPGQPEAFMIWKLIKQWKEAINARVGLILPDLSLGAENLPVSLVNDVDDEKGPAYFTYFPTLKNSKPRNPMEPSTGCICMNGCRPGDPNCPCIKKNGGYLPYNPNAVLVNQKSLIYECGPSCQCPPNCRNRVSQGGLRVRLEVFKTKDKGWGLRSWDPIRAGAFICEYAGEVLADYEVEKLGSENDDDCIFDATRIYQILELPGDSNETPKIPHPLIISAKGIGNVARFMNHSCSPNVFWQPILRENKNELDLHIAFHAVRHIPPMTELTYDYGIVPHDKADLRKKKCLCGSIKCRGYFH